MFNLTPTAKVVLGLLKLGARTGYDIKRVSDVSTRFFWGASYGQIYPELRRLAQAGLVRSKEQPRGGVARTEYTLTPRGERALHEWLTGDPESLIFEYRDEPLLKLFLGDVLTKDEIAANLRGAREQFERVVARFREIEQLAAEDDEDGPRYPAVALQYGIELIEWIVSWYRETERRLESGELPDPQLSS